MAATAEQVAKVCNLTSNASTTRQAGRAASRSGPGEFDLVNDGRVHSLFATARSAHGTMDDDGEIATTHISDRRCSPCPARARKLSWRRRAASHGDRRLRQTMSHLVIETVARIHAVDTIAWRHPGRRNEPHHDSRHAATKPTRRRFAHLSTMTLPAPIPATALNAPPANRRRRTNVSSRRPRRTRALRG